MLDIQKLLFSYQDIKYRDFQINLIPNIESSTIIGVRTPVLRKLAKQIYLSNDYQDFLTQLPHSYFEENNIHAFIIEQIKDYDECMKLLNTFLPYVDNWATCDMMRPKVFKKNLDKLILDVYQMLDRKDTYSIRFGIGMLMQYYLDEKFKEEYLVKVGSISSNEYYINMMISWYFATALAKQFSSTIKYLENHLLSTWVHNKTIQKAVESYRISSEKKEYLRSLRIK